MIHYTSFFWKSSSSRQLVDWRQWVIHVSSNQSLWDSCLKVQFLLFFSTYLSSFEIQNKSPEKQSLTVLAKYFIIIYTYMNTYSYVHIYIYMYVHMWVNEAKLVLINENIYCNNIIKYNENLRSAMNKILKSLLIPKSNWK
jgi:hypothetical protein